MDAPNYSEPSFLDLGPDDKLAYHRIPGRGPGASAAGEERPGKAPPGIVFLGGFRSDMTGTKALRLEAWAKERGRAFLRFDYRGHGRSSGAFEDFGIGDWADDAAAAVARLTEGPQILVGSSMGGWIALLLAKRSPERVAGLVGIAAAPDFTEDGMWAQFSETERRRLMREGRLERPSDYSDEPDVITRHLIEDGRRHLVLISELDLPFPVRLLQGTADRDVPHGWALRLLEHLESPDARLQLVKGADHRFSGERELGILGATLEEITEAIAATGRG